MQTSFSSVPARVLATNITFFSTTLRQPSKQRYPKIFSQRNNVIWKIKAENSLHLVRSKTYFHGFFCSRILSEKTQRCSGRRLSSNDYLRHSGQRYHLQWRAWTMLKKFNIIQYMNFTHNKVWLNWIGACRKHVMIMDINIPFILTRSNNTTTNFQEA